MARLDYGIKARDGFIEAPNGLYPHWPARIYDANGTELGIAGKLSPVRFDTETGEVWFSTCVIDHENGEVKEVKRTFLPPLVVTPWTKDEHPEADEPCVTTAR